MPVGICSWRRWWRRGCDFACRVTRHWDPVADATVERRRDRHSWHARGFQRGPFGFQKIRLEFDLDARCFEEQLAGLIVCPSGLRRLTNTQPPSPEFEVTIHVVSCEEAKIRSIDDSSHLFDARDDPRVFCPCLGRCRHEEFVSETGGG